MTPQRLLLALAGLAGIALRIYIFRTSLGNEDSDEAILGLMVRHAEHGQLTTFLWGQAYGGTLEVLLTVPVFAVFGAGHIALISTPIALDVATVYLVWRVGRRTVGEPAARFAAAVYWLWPAWTLYEHMRQVGFYASDTFFSALVLLLALRAKERPTAANVAVFGLASGVAFYQTFQILPIVVPAASWLVWRERRVLRYAWLAAVLFVVGFLPALLWNLRHNWASAHLNPGAHFSYWWRLRVFFSPVLPEDLGLRFVDSERWLVARPVGLAVYTILVALFAYAAVRTRRREVGLVYLTAAAFPFLYALSPKAVIATEPRYALTLAPCLALIVSNAASTYPRRAAILAIAFTLSAVGLIEVERLSTAHPSTGPVATSPRSVAPVVAALDRFHLTRVFTDYWLAYRLDFDTNERIVAVENGLDRLVVEHGDVVPPPDPKVHWPAYDEAVRTGRHGFVFFDYLPPPDAVSRLLARHGYARHVIPGFVVYVPPSARRGAATG